jgi:hypothetical protein
MEGLVLLGNEKCKTPHINRKRYLETEVRNVFAQNRTNSTPRSNLLGTLFITERRPNKKKYRKERNYVIIIWFNVGSTSRLQVRPTVVRPIVQVQDITSVVIKNRDLYSFYSPVKSHSGIRSQQSLAGSKMCPKWPPKTRLIISADFAPDRLYKKPPPLTLMQCRAFVTGGV